MERFIRSFREGVLNAYLFTGVKEAQLMGNAWIWIDNNQRPHQSLGYQPPTALLKKHQKTDWFPSIQKDDDIEWKSLV